LAKIRIMAKNDSASTFRLVFKGRLTVDRAAEMKKAFQDAVARRKPIDVDVSDATEIDITFFQLLFAAHRAALEAGLAFRLPAEHPPVMQTALREAGLCMHAGLCANTPEQCLWTGGGAQ
jgi:anti-anti-sigma regulatory factor